MAKKDQKDESRLAPVSSQYRTAAGLPPRESDAPTDLSEAALEKRYEPEGGYGGKDGITNTSAINASEAHSAEVARERAEKEAEYTAETGLSGGETATQEALVTGEDTADVKPAGPALVEETPKKGKK